MEDEEYFQPDYTLEIGDVVMIQNSGHGFISKDKNKYVEITGYGDYFGGEGVRVRPHECRLETESCGDKGVVGYGSFGKSPLVLLNVNEELDVKIPSEKTARALLQAREIRNNFDSSLDRRKNGKNKMELVETGFPNAFLALGEVMTWAADYKGYKPNDWKDIPDAKNSLLAAAARHRVKRLAGQDCDDESGLPHLYHEAFNVMAQLELLITGKLE